MLRPFLLANCEFERRPSMKIRLTCLRFFAVLIIFNCHYTFCHVDATQVSDGPNQSAILLIGDHQGLDETDVQNAALLVAEELRAQGIAVSDPVHEVPTSAPVYRVVLRRSGEKILFHLSQEDATGTTLIERELLLADIEDIAPSTPRLVLALVHQEPVIFPTSFFDVGGALGTIDSSSNEDFFSIAIVGIGWSIDKLSYSVDMAGRFSGQNTTRFNSMSVGGRYYFRKRNRSVYVGGGLGVMHTEYRVTSGALFWEYTTDYEEKLGMGVYGVLGIEFLRSAHNRLTLDLRVDRPFFKLSHRDVMPITLGITFSTSRLFNRLGSCLLF